MRSLGIESKVEHVGGGDDRLATLYSNAEIFVYPSLYEGFGIPPLEAMSLGCPVLCSRTSSIPEVVGNAGRYFDPGDIDSIRVAMEEVLYSSVARNKLIQAGFNRCRSFSWSRCAAETAAIYRTLL
jgi:glycosyltransferase involved in cell wall biosynthesis